MVRIRFPPAVSLQTFGPWAPPRLAVEPSHPPAILPQHSDGTSHSTTLMVALQATGFPSYPSRRRDRKGATPGRDGSVCGFKHSVPRKTPRSGRLGVSITSTFLSREIRKRRHEAAYLSSHTSSRRLPLKMLVTMIVSPLT